MAQCVTKKMKIDLKTKEKQNLRCALCKDTISFTESSIADDKKARIKNAFVHEKCALEFNISMSKVVRPLTIEEIKRQREEIKKQREEILETLGKCSEILKKYETEKIKIKFAPWSPQDTIWLVCARIKEKASESYQTLKNMPIQVPIFTILWIITVFTSYMTLAIENRREINKIQVEELKVEDKSER